MSRLRSGRGANAAAAKPAARGRGAAATGGRVFVQTPASDIYVVMLGISLGALLVGALMLALVMNRYEWKTKVSTLTPAASAVALV